MRVFRELDKLPTLQNTVITIGSFDGVHLGHRKILEKIRVLAGACGGQSVVITFDPHPRTVLRPEDRNFKLINTTDEKIALLAETGVDVAAVAPFSADFASLTAEQYVEDFLVEKFRPRYIVIGYDHRFGKNREGNLAFLKRFEQKHGFEVVEIPAQEIDDLAVSSSKIRAALEAGDLRQAQRLMGHPFLLSGMVESGNRVGRTIGFPTANLHLDNPHKLKLPEGIYAARACIASAEDPKTGVEAVYPAMLYLGKRPTLSEDGRSVVEVNLIGFEGDLYGRSLTVQVYDFIRGDAQLDSLDALKAQIARDKKEILNRLAELNKDPGMEIPVLVREQVASNPNPSPGLGTAIVILNYNTRKHLETFLPSVTAHSPGARVIVADNGSPDDSIAFLRANYPEVEVLDMKRNHGFAQGYNEALKQVDAEIYVILNSDVEVTPGWLTPVLQAMQNNPLMAVAQPKILAWRSKESAADLAQISVEQEPSAEETQEHKSKTPRSDHIPYNAPPAKPRSARLGVLFEYAGASGGWIDALGYPFCRGRIFSRLEFDYGQYDAPQECFWASGAAFFVRADLYRRFGGFDGDYFAHNEEIDLCWRLKRAGYSVWCIPQSVVYHLGGGTLEYENPRKVFLNFRNSLFSLLKNESTGKLLWLIPARLLLDGVAAARFAAKGQFRAIRAILEAHLDFYKKFGAYLKKRRDILKLIEKQAIGEKNIAGIYKVSIIVAHYFGRIKEFSKLNSDSAQTPKDRV
jgi:riboflavin kinase/FMN adenylyltransferase